MTIRIAAAAGGALALFALAAPAAAQHAGHAAQGAGPLHVALDGGWHARLDRASDTPPKLEVMAPGWHVTTGPAAIFYDAARTAEGTFRVTSRMHLFDPGERREGYGIFIGGQGLDGDAQRYTYFLLRRDGSFLVKARNGAETPVLQNWTQHEAIRTWDDRESGAASVANELAIDVQAQDVVFLVNGQEVARLPRAQVATDGVVGLRINHGLNVHVESLDVTT